MAEYTQQYGTGEIGVTYTLDEIDKFRRQGLQPPIAHSKDFYAQERRRAALLRRYGNVIEAKKTGRW